MFPWWKSTANECKRVTCLLLDSNNWSANTSWDWTNSSMPEGECVFFLSARNLLVFVNQNFSQHIINRHERTVLHLCLQSVSSSTYWPVCILSFLSTAETDVLVPAFSQSTDGVVVSFVVALKFPNRELKNHDEVHDDDVCWLGKDWNENVSFGGKKET